MKIFTIGFARKNAETFFGLLDRPDIGRVLDIRLKNNSQLAGFTRGADLGFFLKRIIGKEYSHEPLLAPSPEILSGYRDGTIDWPEYERRFRALLDAREVLRRVDAQLLDGACLLCSEPTPDRCHRRLAAEHFAASLPSVSVIHL